MNTRNLPPEDLVKKVRARLQSEGFIVLPLAELDPIFGDEDHRFERILQLHEFVTACDANCEMERDEQHVRFCRRYCVRSSLVA